MCEWLIHQWVYVCLCLSVPECLNGREFYVSSLYCLSNNVTKLNSTQKNNYLSTCILDTVVGLYGLLYPYIFILTPTP